MKFCLSMRLSTMSEDKTELSYYRKMIPSTNTNLDATHDRIVLLIVLLQQFANFLFNLMPRASSRYRTSNVCSCDVSMSGPIAVYATTISVFPYAGM